MNNEHHSRRSEKLFEQLVWLHPRRVLLAQRRGRESLEALAAFADRLTALADNRGRKPVHVIWDMTGLDVAEVDKTVASRAINKVLKHDKVGWFVVIEDRRSSLSQNAIQLALRIVGIHWRTEPTKDDALGFLQHKDPSLL